ncbi:MAG: Rieske (2Fe-2S) domain protein [Verrucomicrobiales bacterium]|nr:Rieske (2Fe-2S) domain protein [Verrucomicrobiales bacterium]
MKIVGESEVAEGKSVKFRFERKGKYVDGFVARFQGELVAFENKCRHLPLSLDYGDNQFFSRDGKHLICQTHGAIYEPISGLCVRGPCDGESLKPIKIEIRNGAIWLAD